MLKSIHQKENKNADIISPPLKSGCGEIITFFICIKNNSIESITFLSSGSQLTTLSLHHLCEYTTNKSLDQIHSLRIDSFLALLPLPLSGKRAEEAAAPLLLLQSLFK